MKTQVGLVYALGALNNFITRTNQAKDPIEQEDDNKEGLTEAAEASTVSPEINDDLVMNARRNRIAQDMWVDYQRYIGY